MKRSSLRRTTGAAAAVLALTLSLAACGDDADEPSSGSDDTTSVDGSDGRRWRRGRGRRRRDLRRRLRRHPDLGQGLVRRHGDRPGRDRREQQPAADHPGRRGQREAGLVDTLNGAEALTVFAPTNDAFAKIPEADLNAVLADKATLTAILTHHVVGEQLDPDGCRR